MSCRLVTSRSLVTAPLEAAIHQAWDASGPHLRQAMVPFVGALLADATPVPRHPTIDALVTSGRMNPTQRPSFTAAADVRVDGVRLGEIPPAMLTASRYEFRYDKPTLETRILAHALTAAGYRDLDVHKRERPDFGVRLGDGRTIHVEVAELHEPVSAEWSNNTARVHIEANDALDADPAQQQKLTGTQLEFKMRALPTSAKARRIASEIGRYIAAGAFEDAPARTLATIDGTYPLMAAHVRVYRAPLRGSRGHLTVQADAHSFDELGLVSVAEKVLTRKRALTYEVQPEWLVLGVTDSRGSFGESVAYFAQHPPAITPFERVFIHNEGRVLILGRDGLIAWRSVSTVGVSMRSGPSSTIDYEPLFKNLWREHIVPEVRRRGAAATPADYVRQAQVVHARDGSICVRLNEESKAAFAFRYHGPPTTTETFRYDPQAIDDVSVVNVADDDLIAAHEVLIAAAKAGGSPTIFARSASKSPSTAQPRRSFCMRLAPRSRPVRSKRSFRRRRRRAGSVRDALAHAASRDPQAA